MITSLESNFDDRVAWASTVDIDRLVDQELDKLSTLFNAAAEYISTTDHTAFFDHRSNTFKQDDQVVLDAPHLVGYYQTLNLPSLTVQRLNAL